MSLQFKPSFFVLLFPLFPSSFVSHRRRKRERERECLSSESVRLTKSNNPKNTQMRVEDFLRRCWYVSFSSFPSSSSLSLSLFLSPCHLVLPQIYLFFFCHFILWYKTSYRTVYFRPLSLSHTLSLSISVWERTEPASSLTIQIKVGERRKTRKKKREKERREKRKKWQETFIDRFLSFRFHWLLFTLPSSFLFSPCLVLSSPSFIITSSSLLLFLFSFSLSLEEESEERKQKMKECYVSSCLPSTNNQWMDANFHFHLFLFPFPFPLPDQIAWPSAAENWCLKRDSVLLKRLWMIILC